MAKIFTKQVVTKNKGEYVRVRHIYRICGIPVYFRTDKISYAKEFVNIYTNEIKPLVDSNFKRYLWGDYPTILSIGEYIVKSPDIVEKTQRLISGMDSTQAGKILKVIRQLKECYLSKYHRVEVNDKDEIYALMKADEFRKNVVELAPDVFCYGGYFSPIDCFFPNVYLYKQGLHFLESKTLEMMKHKDIIDVGGYVGDSAILFEREFTLKNVHTFEATKTNFALMQKTLKLNNSKRIIPVNKGLGSKSETLEISIYGGASTMNDGIKAMFDDKHYFHTETAEIITLDSYVEEHNIEVGFIKVDIEGFEQEFLKGAKETIKKFRPAMLISIYHNYDDFFNIKPLIESWDLGYTFKFDKPIDGIVCVESVLYCEVI